MVEDDKEISFLKELGVEQFQDRISSSNVMT